MSGCCFTGHRILPADKLIAIRTVLKKEITRLLEAGERDFYAGGAYGFDMLAEETVISMKAVCPAIRLHLLLPCPDQSANWSATLRARYDAVLRKADDVCYIAPRFCPGVMAARNRALAKAGSYCIAYLTHGGGTGQTVAMVRSEGGEVFNVAEHIE